MHEEIYESIDAVDQATDFGGKFISNHQVVLGGFEKAKEELMQIQDLVISALGTSNIAAEYGAYIMRQLEVFNTIRVTLPNEIKAKDLQNIKYGGFLTVTQSGSGKDLLEAFKIAYESNFTCFNIVNVEASPITTLIDEIQKEQADKKKQEAPQVLYNSSDEEENEEFEDKNIGLYQKTGHCYSDIKSFIP